MVAVCVVGTMKRKMGKWGGETLPDLRRGAGGQY